MATCSAIGIITDRYIYGIYCHWDGYPENNGRMLVEHYNTIDQIWELIKLGDLSSLGEKIGEQHNEKFAHQVLEGNTGKFCTYYDRDYKRGPHPYSTFQTRTEFKDNFQRAGCEYFYLFEDDQWIMSSSGTNWAPVETYLLTAE